MQVPVASEGPVGDAMRSGMPVLVESAEELVQRWPSLANDQARSGDAATITVPLTLDERILGVLYLAFRRPRRFAGNDLAFLATLAQQCAQALERARLYQQTQEAVRLRDHFISIASHELKNPLTVLLGNAELLERHADRSGTLSATDRQILAAITEQAKRQRRLIDRLLDFSRLQSGQFSVDLAPLDLKPLLERILDDLTPGLEQHAVRLASPSEPVLIEGDELRLEQVITNLVSNAAKYGPVESTITVTLRREQDTAVIEVHDQGPGIPPEERQHIFEPFYRAAQSGSAHVSGSGIGLYVVSQIAAHHGGTVTVESGDSGGAVFRVQIPLYHGSRA
jgi:signal transduction histidine kinase